MPLASIPSGGVGTPFDCGPYGATVTNLGPSTLYYRDEYPIDSVTNFDGTITAGSSTTLTGSRWAFVASGSATLDILPGAPTGQTSKSLVINVKDTLYGAVGDGITDDSAAILAAFTALLAAGGGVLYLPAGTYSIASSSGAPRVPPNFAGQITIRGAGRMLTTIKTSSAAKTFIEIASTVAGDTIQNLIIEDLTVDANNIASNSSGVICQLGGSGLNQKNIRIRRCDTINVGGLVAASTGRRNISIVNSSPFPADATTRTVTDIIIDDCNLGRSGGGGNTGVHISVASSGGSRPPIDRWNAGQFGATNYWFDHITIRDSSHRSGQVATTLCDSANFQISGHGRSGTILLDNLFGSGSGDVGIEVDGAQWLTVRDCRMENSYNAAFFLNENDGMTNPERMTCRYIGCTARTTTAYADTRFKGFASYTLQGAEAGHLVYNNCAVLREQTTFGGFTGATGWYLAGAHKSMTIRDCSYVHKGLALDRAGLAAATAYTPTVEAIRIANSGAESRLLIDGFEYEAEGSCDQGTGTGVLTLNQHVVNIQYASKLQFDIRNVRSGGAGFTRAGAVTPTVRLREIQFPITATSTDALDGGSSFLTDVVADAGATADCAQAAGVITSTGNHSTKRRFRWLDDSGSGSITSAATQIGKWQDASLLVTGTSPGTLSGWELGAFLKGDDAGTSYLEGVATDDGSNSFLKIRKCIAGSVTELATKTLGSRLAVSTGYGARFKQQGNLLTLDLFTGVGARSFGTAADIDSLTFTLLTTDIAAFGIDSGVGWLGPSWIPIDGTATLDRLAHDRMHVYGGTITRVIPRYISRTLTAYSALRSNDNSATTRIMGTVRVRDSDFSQRRNHTTPLDMEHNGSTLKPYFQFERHQWAVPPTMNGTITAPGSGVAYTNTDGYAQDVFIYGGTLTTPFVEVSRDGGVTFAQVAGSSVEKTVRLDVGDQLRTTYSVAPTFRKVPVL